MELALYEGNPAIVQSLLNYSVDPETKNTHGDTALIQACKQGQHAVAEVLLKAGANPNAQTHHARNSYPHARTALCIACYNGNVNLVRVLLTHGASVYGAPEPGQTPLGISASKGHTEILSMLLAHGASANSLTGFPRLDFTALINASEACHPRAVENPLPVQLDSQLLMDAAKLTKNMLIANKILRCFMVLAFRGQVGIPQMQTTNDLIMVMTIYRYQDQLLQ